MSLPPRKRKHLSQGSTLPITDPEVIWAIEQPQTDEEWNRAAKQKKLDANDLVHQLGPAGFLAWLDKAPVYCHHRRETSIVSLTKLIGAYPNMNEIIVDGLLRRGEIMNVIAAPKVGKSMIVGDLAAAIISGQRFLQRWQCARGRILICDNELHCATIAHRYKLIAESHNIQLGDAGAMIDFIPLRGQQVDLNTLEEHLEGARHGNYSVIILDALYKLFPPRTDENDNAAMAGLYAKLDYYASRLDAAFVVIHHASKGVQGDRAVTDVGAGGGAQSRATDTHMILRPHETPGVVVIDAVPRTFPPVERFCARFQYPRWIVDTASDPQAIQGSATRRDAAIRAKQRVEIDGRMESILVPAMRQHGASFTEAEVMRHARGLNIEPWSKAAHDRFMHRFTKQVQERRGQTPARYELRETPLSDGDERPTIGNSDSRPGQQPAPPQPRQPAPQVLGGTQTTTGVSEQPSAVPRAPEALQIPPEVPDASQLQPWDDPEPPPEEAGGFSDDEVVGGGEDVL